MSFIYWNISYSTVLMFLSKHNNETYSLELRTPTLNNAAFTAYC